MNAPLPRGALLPEQLGDLGRAVLTLAQELWRVQDRQIVLEAVLAQHGHDGLVAEVDRFVPDPETAKRLAAAREALTANLVRALMGEGDTDGFGFTATAPLKQAAE